MAAALPVTTTQRVSSLADKIVLAIVFFGGAAGIIALKEYDYPREWIPALPAALMIFYFVFVFWTRRFRLRDDVTGDNLYYLGFLYTLTSLAYALYVFARPGRPLENVVTEFGVALVTTILGVFLRIVAVQLREDPVEIEREARLELADAATRLRGVLGTVVLDMNHFRRQIAQSIEEGMTAVADQASKSVTETTERFREVTDALLKHMEAVSGARADSSRRLNELVATTIAAFEAVLERINRIEPPADLIERKLAPAVLKIEQAAEAARARASAGADELKMLSDLATKAVRATADLDRRVQTLLSVCSLIDELGQRLGSFTAALAAQEAGVTGVLERQYQVLDVLRQSAEARAAEATASFARAIEAQEQVLRGFREEFQSQPGEALAVLTEAVRAHTKALQELSGSAAAAVSTVRAHNAELDAELDRSRRLTLDVQNELVSLAETVTRRLA